MQNEYFSPPALLELAIKTSIANLSKSTIAVSDVFPAPKEAFTMIKQFSCSAIEKESTGVFYAAQFYKIPVEVTISNNSK